MPTLEQRLFTEKLKLAKMARDAGIMLRQANWRVERSRDMVFDVFNFNVNLNSKTIGDSSQNTIPAVVDSVDIVRYELQQIIISRYVPVAANEVKRALNEINGGDHYRFRVDYLPHRTVKPTWPVPLMNRAELYDFIIRHVQPKLGERVNVGSKRFSCRRCGGTGRYGQYYRGNIRSRRCFDCEGRGFHVVARYKLGVELLPIRVLRKMAWESLEGHLKIQMVGAAAIIEAQHTVVIKDMRGGGSGLWAAQRLVEGKVERAVG